MTLSHSSQKFPRAATWIGVLILATGMATINQPLALASTSHLATSSIQWTGLSETAVLSGGLARDFLTGTEGWGAPALTQAGLMGVEWDFLPGPPRRTLFYSINHTLDSEQGSQHTLETVGYMVPDHSRTIEGHITTTLSGNQATWSMELLSLSPEAMEDLRFFWIASLPPGYDSVFHTPDPNTLLIRDSSLTHPTLVLHATASAGVTGWASATDYQQPPSSTETAPTFYLHSTLDGEIHVTITLGVIDHDPCSQDQALAFAATNPGTFGAIWPILNSCMTAPEWPSIVAGSSPTTMGLDIDPRVPSLAPNQTREINVLGLPEGVTWSRLPDEGTSLYFEINTTSETPAGDYTVEFDARTRTDEDGLVGWSQPLQTSATLTIEAAPPEPDPEPEPEPDPEVIEEEDVAHKPEEETPDDDEAEPEKDDSPEPEEGEEESEITPEPDKPHKKPQRSGTKTDDSEPSVEPIEQASFVPATIQEPSVEEDNSEPVFVPDIPMEVDLFVAPEDPIDQRLADSTPELTAQTAWLGAGLLVATGISTLYAIIRRRKSEEEE